MEDRFEYRSSVAAFEEFIKTAVWADIQYELNQWLIDIHTELEDNGGQLTDKQLHRLGGNAETLKKVLDLPENVMENILAAREESD